MNSASQSNSAAGAARLLGDMETLTKRGWALAAPMWFPLLWVTVSVLASVPAALLLDRHNGAQWYWIVVTPVGVVVCAWYFMRRPVQVPDGRGMAVALTSVAMAVTATGIGWVYRGEWAIVAPWLAVGVGLAVLAVALRSAATAAVAAVTMAVSLAVGLIDPAHGYAWLALVVGLAAALAAGVELLRAEAEPRA
ncbi:hypothetical protein ACFYT3_00635 [Nocardia amikacinitolerans]|uniref:hypothetical protein n=1 Tax=Nocardia amikacinitolerans TaxID=756689 RepID=UPI0036BB6263